MKIQTNSVNFQSKIKLVDMAAFNAKTKALNPKKHEVGYPWTPETMKKGKNLFTTQIMDCIAGGIVDNGKVAMFHLCTRHQKDAKKTRQKGFSIKEIERRILERVNLENENLHAFILGGFHTRENSKYNVNKLNKIKNVFEKHKIPYSILGARRDVHYFGRYSLLFDNKEDTWYVANALSNSRGPNGDGAELEVLENSVNYHTYEQKYDKYGVRYDRKKHSGSAEDFLRSQFRQVVLCKFDSFA